MDQFLQLFPMKGYRFHSVGLEASRLRNTSCLLIDERTRGIAKTSGFKSNRMEALSFHWDQLKGLVQTGSSRTGKTNLDQSLVIDSIFAGIAGDLVQNPDGTATVDKRAPSLSATLALLGLNAKTGTGRTRLNWAVQTRKALKVSKGVSRNEKWLTILKRYWRGHRKITPAVKEAIVSWVRQHGNVATLPIYSETLLVKGPGSSEKHRVPKLLLEIPVRELHNLLLAPTDQGGLAQSRDEENKILCSDTTLRRIIRRDLPELRRMSLRHKQMCGCEICISMHSLHKSLNGFRQRLVRTLTIPETQQTPERTQQIQTYKDTVLRNG